MNVDILCRFSSECCFIKLRIKQINSDGRSKSSAVILKFWISQGSVATQLRWSGRPCYRYVDSFLGNLSVSVFAKVMIKSECLVFETQWTKSWSKVNGKQDICIALYSVLVLISKTLRLARVNEGSHSFTCHPHVYPQVKWTILPLLPSRRASPHCGRYSFPVPLGVGGWVGLNPSLNQRSAVGVKV